MFYRYTQADINSLEQLPHGAEISASNLIDLANTNNDRARLPLPIHDVWIKPENFSLKVVRYQRVSGGHIKILVKEKTTYIDEENVYRSLHGYHSILLDKEEKFLRYRIRQFNFPKVLFFLGTVLAAMLVAKQVCLYFMG